MRTVLIMAGGTGGHIFPALAVAEQLREKDWRVVWLGSKIGMESKLVPQYGFEMEWVRFSGLRGKGVLRALLLPISLLVAFGQSARAIFRVRPDVVLGMGGYISFPGGVMAALLARPLVLHEQNAKRVMGANVVRFVFQARSTQQNRLIERFSLEPNRHFAVSTGVGGTNLCGRARVCDRFLGFALSE